MKLLLTPGGIKNPSIQVRAGGPAGRPIAECSALCIPTAQWGTPDVRTDLGAAVRRRRAAVADEQPGLEIGGGPGADWRCRASTRSGGRRSGRPTSCWWRWRRDVPVPLDAELRAGRPPVVAARDGLGGGERREHGDDPRIGNDFVAWRLAPNDRTLGVVDFSIFPHLNHEMMPREHLGRGRAVGYRDRAAGVRHRRSDGHQGGRRRHRGRVRGAVETARLVAAASELAPVTRGLQHPRTPEVPHRSGADPHRQ